MKMHHSSTHQTFRRAYSPDLPSDELLLVGDATPHRHPRAASRHSAAEDSGNGNTDEPGANREVRVNRGKGGVGLASALNNCIGSYRRAAEPRYSHRARLKRSTWHKHES